MHGWSLQQQRQATDQQRPTVVLPRSRRGLGGTPVPGTGTQRHHAMHESSISVGSPRNSSNTYSIHSSRLYYFFNTVIVLEIIVITVGHVMSWRDVFTSDVDEFSDSHSRRTCWTPEVRSCLDYGGRV